MSPTKSTPRNTSNLAARVCANQLQVFRSCFTLFCTLPCILLVTYLSPAFMSFMGTGPQTSSMTVLKLLILIPIVLLFVGIGYVATLLAAIGNVFFIRLAVPELRMPEAHPMLMQFYSDLRWVNFLWGGMAKNKRLIRMCQRLTAWTIPLVYGRAAPANLP